MTGRPRSLKSSFPESSSDPQGKPYGRRIAGHDRARGRSAANPSDGLSGYLTGGSPASNAPYQRALISKPEDLGYREGHNLVPERRFADGRLDRLPELAVALVALKPDIVFPRRCSCGRTGSSKSVTLAVETNEQNLDRLAAQMDQVV